MYLTYDEYITMGGTLTEAAFTDVELDAEIVINWYTFDRLVNVTSVDSRVKSCVFKMMDALIAKQNLFSVNSDTNAPITSQSNDGVSVSYGVLTASEMITSADKELKQIVTRYLSSVTDDSGRKVLYRGLYSDE